MTRFRQRRRRLLRAASGNRQQVRQVEHDIAAKARARRERQRAVHMQEAEAG